MSHHSHESITFSGTGKHLDKAPRKQITILGRGAEGIIITNSRFYLLSTYYMLNTVLNASRTLSHLILTTISEVNTIAILVLQLRKLNPKDMT